VSTPGLPGDKLFAPLNAPQPGAAGIGVQPGVSGSVVLAQYVIIFGASGGMFVYAGAPGPGNPPVYSVSNADADPYGNTVEPGIWAGPPGSVQVGMQAEPGSNFGQLLFITPGGPFSADGAVFGIEQGGGQALAVSSSTVAAAPDHVEHSYQDNLAGAGSARMESVYFDTTGTFHVGSALDFTGFTVSAGSITAVDPATGTSLGNPFAAETWHNVTVDAGWGSLGEPAQYRLLPDGNVQLRGDISHAATAAQTDINSGVPLPAAYRPAATRYYRPPQAADLAGAVQVASSGIITMRASGFAATQAILDGIYSR